MYELMVEETFDAAHALRGYKGSCENLHGHTWKVQLFIKGEILNNIGLLVDFREIKKHLSEVLEKFDHKNLNDLLEFKEKNPSSENIAKFIFETIKANLPILNKVTVWESPTTWASFSND